MKKLEKIKYLLVIVWLSSWVVMIINAKTTIINLNEVHYLLIIIVFIVSLAITIPIQIMSYVKGLEKIRDEEDELDKIDELLRKE